MTLALAASPVLVRDLPRGELARARHNIRVLELLANLDGRTHLTEGEQHLLAAWTGWGPMAQGFELYQSEPAWSDIHQSLRLLLDDDAFKAAKQATFDSFFTPPEIAEAMWRLLAELGFTGGRVLEPGCGNGAFMAAAPTDLPITWVGVDSDPTAARIARLLHPRATIIERPLEKVALRLDSFDAVVGNVPFGKITVHDPLAPPSMDLHNYFLWRSIRAARPGALVVAFTATSTLDNPYMVSVLREAGAEFVGAVRLPGRAFSQAGTRAITDIIVLRRTAEPARDWPRPPDDGSQLDDAVNTYFLDNPGQIIGDAHWVTKHNYGKRLKVEFAGGQEEYLAALEAALQRVADWARAAELTWQPPHATVQLDDLLPPLLDGRKEGSFHLAEDGKAVVQIVDGTPQPVRATAELRALIALRDAALELIAGETDLDQSDEALSPLRARANELYDAYFDRYGALNRATLLEGPEDEDTGLPTFTRRRPALGGFRADPDCPTVLALERHDDETGATEKSPLLERRVNRRCVRPERADNPGEALAYCLDELGRLDVDRIGELLGVPAERVPDLLGDLAFHDPVTGELETAQVYLSGNVRTKLAVARRAAERDPQRWDRNVAALEAVQPEDLSPEDIIGKLGAPWIPTDVVADFLRDTLGMSTRVAHEPLTGAWELALPHHIMDRPVAYATWGTRRCNAYRLVQLALNNSAPIVHDETATPDGAILRVRNQTETLAAEEKQRALQVRFAEWLWEDPARTNRLVKLYNERYNSVRLPVYDGSHLTFPGLVDGAEPYPSQREIVWRMICQPATLCGHTVGAGKTLAMAMAAMKMRQMGLVKKPLIVVPNHLLEETTAEILRWYPTARVLMATKDDLARQQRKRFIAQVAVGDWDCVVMTHPSFTSLPVGPQAEAEYLAELIEQYEEAAAAEGVAGTRTVKQMAKKIARMRAEYERLRERRVDDGLTFEHTGIDWIAIDEAHLFKSLPLACRMEGFSFRSSKRAVDLATKRHYLRRRNPGDRWGALFTGTPVDNSHVEIYIALMYLMMPERLAELDLANFDAFAGQFITWATGLEVAPDGSGFRQHRRPGQFVNVPELRMLLAQVADIRSREQLQLPGCPQVTREVVAVDPDPRLREYNVTLVERADRIRAGGISSSRDNMFLVCGDGRAAALDLTLVGVEPTVPGKADAVARQIAAIYHETKDNQYQLPDGSGPSPIRGAFQLVFCDLGVPGETGPRVYGRIRERLLELGVPKEKIQFIHSAKNSAEKAALFRRCRTGEVAVLLASTEKAGTGVNIQHRMVALHHVDAPWTPARVGQRDGRLDRPGNWNPNVRIYRYVTRSSFDAYVWQGLERKAKVSEQVLTGTLDVRVIEDVGPVVQDYGEVMAIATGQPLIVELQRVKAELARLRSLAVAHHREQRQLRVERDALVLKVNANNSRAEKLEQLVRATKGEPALILSSGETYTDLADVGRAIVRAIHYHVGGGRVRLIGTWQGLYLEIVQKVSGKGVDLEVATHKYGANLSLLVPLTALGSDEHAAAVGAQLATAVREAGTTAAQYRERAAQARQALAEYEGLLDQPFEHADKITALKRRQAEIEAAIDGEFQRQVAAAA